MKVIIYILVLLLVIANSFDIKVIGLFRYTDIIYWTITFFFLIHVFSKTFLVRVNQMTKGFFICLLASTAYGWIFYPEYMNETNTFGFIYKYLILFVLYGIIVNVRFTLSERVMILKALAVSLFFIVIHTFYYADLYRGHLGHYISSRPDFPFSEEGGHVLGTYLAVGVAALYFYMEKRFSGFKRLISVTIIFLVLTAVFLTGSRAPIIAVFCAFLYVYVSRSFRKRRFVFKKLIYSILFLMLIATGIVYIYEIGAKEMEIVQLERSFKMDFSQDESYIGRLDKQSIVIDFFLKHSTILLGMGTGLNIMLFYDGSITRILVDSGALGLLFFIGIIFSLIHDVRKKAKRYAPSYIDHYMVPLIVFIVCNLSSEHFLINRSMIPVIIYLSIIHGIIDDKKREAEATAIVANTE